MRAPLFLLLAACSAAPVGKGDSDTVDTFEDRRHDTEEPPACPSTTWTEPPACGSGPIPREAVLQGALHEDYEEALATKALRHERLFHGLITTQTGVNSELWLGASDTAAKEAIQTFLDGDGWDLAASAGKPVTELVGSGGWTKVAGGYAGPGIAADAFRYGVLRDEGAPCEEVERARQHLLHSLEALHIATAITGVPGVIARGFARADVPGYGTLIEPIPLFDDVGAPLPEEKTNGTWRTDQSGDYPGWVWEDSCSRDMFIGWAAGFGAAWEVIALDPTFPATLKDRMRADATALARSLMTVQDSGYDLDIMDADGRRTYHGVLSEESIDRAYVPDFRNGPNAMMALGAVASLAAVSGDEAVLAWLADELLAARELHVIALEGAAQLDFGTQTNFSGYNMAFLGGMLAQRYLCDADARGTMASAVLRMYDLPGEDRQPAEQEQSLYDLAAVLASQGASAWSPPSGPADDDVLKHILRGLKQYPEAPFWNEERINCDEEEVSSGSCRATDGTPITVLSTPGRNGVIIAERPVPMRVRPPSNYYWRSNPYQVNGEGDGNTLFPAVDYRIVYWMGRWARR